MGNAIRMDRCTSGPNPLAILALVVLAEEDERLARAPSAAKDACKMVACVPWNWWR